MTCHNVVQQCSQMISSWIGFETSMTPVSLVSKHCVQENLRVPSPTQDSRARSLLSLCPRPLGLAILHYRHRLRRSPVIRYLVHIVRCLRRTSSALCSGRIYWPRYRSRCSTRRLRNLDWAHFGSHLRRAVFRSSTVRSMVPGSLAARVATPPALRSRAGHEMTEWVCRLQVQTSTNSRRLRRIRRSVRR